LSKGGRESAGGILSEAMEVAESKDLDHNAPKAVQNRSFTAL